MCAARLRRDLRTARRPDAKPRRQPSSEVPKGAMSALRADDKRETEQKRKNKAFIGAQKAYGATAAAACVTVNRDRLRFRSEHCYDSYLLALSDGLENSGPYSQKPVSRRHSNVQSSNWHRQVVQR